MKEIKYAFRLVHIANIPHILEKGIAFKDSPNADPNYIPIGDSTAIATRAQKKLPNGEYIGSYIPFYFGPRSPMLYVIQHGHNGVKQYGPEDLVYCIIKLETILSSNISCIFTDGHALNYLTELHPQEDLRNINEIVNFNDVYAEFWTSDDDRDLKRRKEAELLIKEEIPPQLISGYIVYNLKAYERLIQYGISCSKIIIKKEYYF